MSDGGNTSFVAYQGGNANNSASWTDAAPLAPPGGEPRLAGGPAGLVMLYRIGEPGKRTLAARKFDGTSFGDEEIVSEAGDPIEFDLSAEPSTGEFHAAWVDNRSPNELRWSRSKDGLTWTKPQTVTRGDENETTFHTQVAAAPDERGFAVWDQLSQNTEIRAVPLFPGASFDGAADSPAGSTTVGGQQITLFAPGGCINPGTPLLLRVTSKTKKKLSPKKRVKIVKVDFFLGKKKKTDKKAAFKAKFSTAKLAAPSTHKLRAKVLLRPVVGNGKKKTETLKGKLKICG